MTDPLNRWRAIGLALYFGILPSRLYEDEPHHELSYLEHLAVNLRYAYRWLRGRQTPDDELFELSLNTRPRLLAPRLRERLEVNLTLLAIAGECLAIRARKLVGGRS